MAGCKTLIRPQKNISEKLAFPSGILALLVDGQNAGEAKLIEEKQMAKKTIKTLLLAAGIPSSVMLQGVKACPRGCGDQPHAKDVWSVKPIS